MEQMLYTVMEAARLMKSNKQYVYKLIESGQLPAIKLGNIKIPRVELEKFILSNLGKDLTDPYNVSDLKSQSPAS